MKANCTLKRSGRYFIHDLKTALSRSWIITLTMAMFPVLYFLIYAYVGHLTQNPCWKIGSHATTAWIYEGVAILYFLFVPITCYGRNTEKSKGTAFILLPASDVVKFISMTIISIIILPLIFIISFIAIDHLLFLIAPERFIDGMSLSGRMLSLEWSPLFIFNKNLIVNLGFLSGLFLPFMVSSAGLCGAWLFKKGNKQAKTFLTCALSFITLMAILILVAENQGSNRWFTPENVGLMSVSWVVFQIFCALCCLSYVYLKIKKIQL